MSITVIELWPRTVTCQRCGEDTFSTRCWPYYEEFLHPDDANTDGGYVPVCGECFCWLEDHSGQLYLRKENDHSHT